MRTNIIVTGFYGTGSGAIIDLLREYDDFFVPPYGDRDYEHVPLYYSSGLFDLYRQLAFGGCLYSDDKSIHNFIEAMHRLNDYDYFWFGSYRRLFGNDFIRICDELIDAISFSRPGSSSNHIVRTRFSPIKAFAQLALRVFLGKKFSRYGIKYIRDTKDVYSVIADDSALHEAFSAFIKSYFDLFSRFSDSGRLVFDHLVFSSQLDTFKSLFPPDTKFIIVDRDPRDVYLLDHFIWNKKTFFHKPNDHFPLDVDLFSKEWKKTVVYPHDAENVLCLHYEDVIYDYDATVKRIEKCIGGKLLHKNPSKYLDVTKSIENTQLFLCSKEWETISEALSQRLPNYIYSFPYKRVPNTAKTFSL